MPGTMKTALRPRSRCLGPHCPFTGHAEDKIAMHPRYGRIQLMEGFCCGRCRLGDPGHGPCCTLEVHWSVDKEDDIMGATDLWDDGRPSNAKPVPAARLLATAPSGRKILS